MEKALPRVVPSTTVSEARKLFLESRQKGVAVVIVTVKVSFNHTITADTLVVYNQTNQLLLVFALANFLTDGEISYEFLDSLKYQLLHVILADNFFLS